MQCNEVQRVDPGSQQSEATASAALFAVTRKGVQEEWKRVVREKIVLCF